MSDNPFALLNFPEIFQIDQALLEDHYFQAQRLSHPDKNAAESQTLSAKINQAYTQLRDPLKRAQALIELKQWVLPSMAQDLLADMFEWQIKLNEAVEVPALEDWGSQAQQREAEILIQLSLSFHADDLQGVAQAYYELSYIQRLLQQWKEKTENK